MPCNKCELKKRNDPDKYCPAPPTADVYNMIQVGVGFNRTAAPEDVVLERIRDVKVPLDKRIDDPSVYGYDEDGKLVLGGGKMYTDALKTVDYRVHATNVKLEQDVTLENVSSTLPLTADFLTARGFQIAGPDTSPLNEESFNWRPFFGAEVINIKPHYENESDPLPAALDVCSYGAFFFTGVVPYNPDEANRDKRFSYPFRVPLTTDKKEFKCRCNCKDPIVFYNDITQQLIFSVRDINHVAYSNPEFSAPTPEDPEQVVKVEIRMHGFEGKFQLTRRDNINQLIPSTFRNAQMLVQTSETVDVKARGLTIPDVGAPSDISFSRTYRDAGGNYQGVVARLINGGMPSFDVYLINIGILNAFSNIIDPFLSLPTCCSNNLEGAGDNPYTPGRETLAGATKFVTLDSAQWDLALPLLSEEFLADPPLPEDFATYPLAKDPGQFVMSLVNAHEYVHSIGFGLGNITLLDTEAQALAIELNSEINKGVYAAFRPRDFVEYTTWHSRGLWNIGQTDNGDLGPETIPFGTYGGGMWWNWLARTHDPYYQVMRRSNDLLALETATQINFGSGGFGAPYYGGANRLAQKQALQELFGLDLSEVYKLFAISLSVIRNNKALPEAVRSKYPFWTQQKDYVDAEKTAFFGPESAFWWTEFDTNANPSNAASRSALGLADLPEPYNDLTMQPQLNKVGSYNLSLRDLASNIFVVDESLGSVKVTSNKGRITVTAHKYDPSTKDGSLKIDGPTELAVGKSKTFNVCDFPGPGLLRLIISNVTITDLGGGLKGKKNFVIPSDQSVLVTGGATVTVA